MNAAIELTLASALRAEFPEAEDLLDLLHELEEELAMRRYDERRTMRESST